MVEQIKKKNNLINYTFGILILGILVLIISRFTKNVSNSIIGYSTINLGMIFLIILTGIHLLGKKTIWPLVAIITVWCCVTWLIVIDSIYFNKINENHVAKEYYTYSMVSTILLFIQIFVSCNFLFNFSNDNNFALKLMCLNYLQLIIIAFMQVILQFFSTDG